MSVASDLLARLAERPAEAAILLDVDGTLAPIVSRPDEAVVPEQTRAVLSGSSSATGWWRVSADGRGRMRRASSASMACATSGSTAWSWSPGRRMGGAASQVRRVRRLARGRGKAAHALLSLPVRGRRRRGRKCSSGGRRPCGQGRVAPSVGSAGAQDPSADRGGQGDCGRAAARRSQPAAGAVRRRRHDDLNGFRGLDGLEVAVRDRSRLGRGPLRLAEAADVIAGGPEALAEASHSCTHVDESVLAPVRTLRRAVRSTVGGRGLDPEPR